MAAQKGKDLLLKIDSTGAGAFVTVAGLRARSIAFNANTVDITHQESAGQWRELLAGAGVRSVRVTGAGIFKDAASDETVRSVFFASLARNYQIIVPEFGTIVGPFIVHTLTYGGQHDSEVTFEITLESAGEIIFTAV